MESTAVFATILPQQLVDNLAAPAWSELRRFGAGRGLEPLSGLLPLAPQASASANSATSAFRDDYFLGGAGACCGLFADPPGTPTPPGWGACPGLTG
jgi:hypothetical protein